MPENTLMQVTANAIVFVPDFATYKKLTGQINNVVDDYLVESMSISAERVEIVEDPTDETEDPPAPDPQPST